MKREEIKNIIPTITDEQLKQVMDIHSTDIGTLSTKISTLQTERDAFEGQLRTANDTIKSYKDMDIDGIKQKAIDWETKYNTDTQALKAKLTGMEYDRVAGIVTSNLKFTSAGAKKAFLADMKAKGLKVDGDKLLGYEDFLKGYKESDPDTFAQADGTVPKVVDSTSGGSGAPSDSLLRAAFGLSTKTKE